MSKKGEGLEEKEVGRYSKLWTMYIDSLIGDNLPLVRTILSACLDKVYYRVEDKDGDEGIVFKAEVKDTADELIKGELLAISGRAKGSEEVEEGRTH